MTNDELKEALAVAKNALEMIRDRDHSEYGHDLSWIRADDHLVSLNALVYITAIEEKATAATPNHGLKDIRIAAVKSSFFECHYEIFHNNKLCAMITPMNETPPFKFEFQWLGQQAAFCFQVYSSAELTLAVEAHHAKRMQEKKS